MRTPRLRHLCWSILAAGLVATSSAAVAAAAPDSAVGGSAQQHLTSVVAAGSAAAARVGANVSIAILDRQTGAYAETANAHGGRLTASVVKVFIADKVLRGDASGSRPLSGADRSRLTTMLQRSDDGAADYFWNSYGKNKIVSDIAARYGLTETAPPVGAWWNTTISAADMVKYYRLLITEAPKAVSRFIVPTMRGWQPTGTDGENQTFGLPSALSATPVKAIKQGWMPLNNGDWVHNTTGLIGPTNRYLVAIFASQPARGRGEQPTVDGLNAVTRAMFPRGLV